MPSLLLSFLIYIISYLYLSTAALNFFLPIAEPIAALILLGSIVFATCSTRFIPFNTFSARPIFIDFSGILPASILSITILWAGIALFRPTIEGDGTSYHLPVSLLMNHSVWYPGIGKLSSHFGFPNGVSVISSVFTTFSGLSVENIPNLVMWLILGLGVFLYLIKHEVNSYLSLVISIMYMIDPDIFWQSYNLGTDLPSACFRHL
jgi:hypothetical protein